MDRVKIMNYDGTYYFADLVTFLVNEDKTKRYVVYSKGEVYGAENNKVIYISRILKQDIGLYLEEVTDNEEWENVQHLLKLIANA